MERVWISHPGIPWLLYLRRQLKDRVHFWPFDGWQIPAGRSAVAEVYPALWKHAFAAEGRNADQHDAYSVAAWLCQADFDGQLAGYLNPSLSPRRAHRSRSRRLDSRGWLTVIVNHTNCGSWAKASASMTSPRQDKTGSQARDLARNLIEAQKKVAKQFCINPAGFL